MSFIFRKLPRTLIALVLAFVVIVPARDAFAAGGGASVSTLIPIVSVVLGIAVAYLLAHFVVEKVQERVLMLAGLEYIGLGMLLTTFDLVDLTGLMPLIALAAGWVGLLRGMDLDIERVQSRPDGTMRIVLLHHIVPAAVVGGLAFWLFTESGLFLQSWTECAAVAMLLACCAAADGMGPLDVVEKRYKVEGELTHKLRIAARIGDVLVIVAFGLIFAIFHEPINQVTGGDFSNASEWIIIEILLGVVLGIMFTLVLGGHETPNGRFLAMTGIIAFTSGAAVFLRVSPLAVNVYLGMVLVNIAKTGHVMRDTLLSTEKPVMLLLFVLAGALWEPPPLAWALGGFGVFVLLRLFSKMLASRMSGWGQSDTRPDLYRGLLAHGEVTVAMAVSFQVVFDGDLVNLAYTIILMSVVLHDLISPRVLRGLLVDAGAIRRERRSNAPAQPSKGHA